MAGKLIVKGKKAPLAPRQRCRFCGGVLLPREVKLHLLRKHPQEMRRLLFSFTAHRPVSKTKPGSQSAATGYRPMSKTLSGYESASTAYHPVSKTKPGYGFFRSDTPSSTATPPPHSSPRRSAGGKCRVCRGAAIPGDDVCYIHIK